MAFITSKVGTLATVIKPTKLQENIGQVSWRGINFPYSEMKTNVDQQLVAHEYADRDSAYVESMGRKPITVTCNAIFNNYIFPSAGESWVAGNLFPFTFDEFRLACMDSSPGSFTHPVLGTFTAKCSNFSFNLSTDNFGGVNAQVAWIETTAESSTPQFDTSGLPGAAVEMMDALGSVVALQTQAAAQRQSFLDVINSIGSYIALSGILGRALLGKIDYALYIVNKFIAAVQSQNDIGNGAVRLALERMKYLLINAKKTAGAANTKSVVSYRPPTNTTLVDIARTVGTPLMDLMKLNPNLAKQSIIVAGTPVLYLKNG